MTSNNEAEYGALYLAIQHLELLTVHHVDTKYPSIQNSYVAALLSILILYLLVKVSEHLLVILLTHLKCEISRRHLITNMSSFLQMFIGIPSC